MSQLNSEDPQPGQDIFTEEDLAGADPSARRVVLDKVATIVAVLAYGMVGGGMVALGACAAPMVFQLAPYPFSGQAMGAAFSRFDYIAVACGVVGLGAEGVRTLLTLRTTVKRAWIARARRYAAIVLALGTVYTGTQLSPQIMTLHQAGVRRHVGVDGEELERIHKQAELIGKLVVALAAALIALHIATLPTRGDDEDVAAPLPPGLRPR